MITRKHIIGSLVLLSSLIVVDVASAARMVQMNAIACEDGNVCDGQDVPDRHGHGIAGQSLSSPVTGTDSAPIMEPAPVPAPIPFPDQA